MVPEQCCIKYVTALKTLGYFMILSAYFNNFELVNYIINR